MAAVAGAALFYHCIHISPIPEQDVQLFSGFYRWRGEILVCHNRAHHALIVSLSAIGAKYGFHTDGIVVALALNGIGHAVPLRQNVHAEVAAAAGYFHIDKTLRPQ